MKKDCNIVNDLLPLYVEDMTSEESKNFIEEHIKDCDKCKETLGEMKSDDYLIKEDINEFKAVKKKMNLKKIQYIFLSSLFVMIILTSLFSYTSAKEYIPYSEDLISVHVGREGEIDLLFRDDIKRYSVEKIKEENSYRYNVEAWEYESKTLDFIKEKPSILTITPKENEKFVIYYNQNNGQEDILLYKNVSLDYGGVVTLPRLALAYYFLLSIVIFIILSVLWIIFRKKSKIRFWIENILYVPLSYIIGHLLIKGIKSSSYQMIRDFSLIILVGTFIYLFLLTLRNIYTNYIEKKRNIG